jgi:hypothetical protein
MPMFKAKRGMPDAEGEAEWFLMSNRPNKGDG